MCVFVDVCSYVVKVLKEVCTGRSLVPTQMTILMDVLVNSVSLCKEKEEGDKTFNMRIVFIRPVSFPVCRLFFSFVSALVILTIRKCKCKCKCKCKYKCKCKCKSKPCAQRETEEMKKMKNRLQLQPRPSGELISSYSYSRASAGN